MNPKIFSALLMAAFILSACVQAAPQSPPLPDVILAVNAVAGGQPQASECLSCHTDMNRLIETAKPEEVVEKESSGAG